jgi:hypothetical protein
MTTNIRHPVLISRIPEHGRHLTAAERRALIDRGVTVPARSYVMRAHASDYIGALYRAARGGWSDLGVSVQTR